MIWSNSLPLSDLSLVFSVRFLNVLTVISFIINEFMNLSLINSLNNN